MAAQHQTNADVEVTRLDTAWQLWLVENLARGVPAADLVAELMRNGVSAPDAEVLVSLFDAPASAEVVRQLIEQRRRRDVVLDLARSTHSLQAIERRRVGGTKDFLEILDAQQPVVLEGFATDWPAYRRWSPEWFAAELGDVQIDVCIGRSSDPHPDRNFENHRATMTVSEFITRLPGAEGTNDLYAISNNDLMARPEFASLLDDVTPDPTVFPRDRFSTDSIALWIGPAGTVTPLHHDVSNVVLVQLYGTKRFWCCSPLEIALADSADGFYAEIDISDPGWTDRFPDVSVLIAECGPGDAMFLPVGWWHRVEALETSISFGLLGFGGTNNYDWYRPGTARS